MDMAIFSSAVSFGIMVAAMTVIIAKAINKTNKDPYDDIKL